MNKYFSNIRTLAALLMAGAAFAACSSDENTIEQPANPAGEQVYTLTINATKGGADTRALKLEDSTTSLDGKKLTAYWENGEKLTVYNETRNSALTGTLTASNASGATATFSGELTGTILQGDVLRLSYHTSSGLYPYATQTGTLASAAEHDFAKATVTVASVSSGEITTNTDANFETQTAVLKLTLQDNAATPNKLNATTLQMSATVLNNMFTFSPTAATYTTNGDGVLYFTLPSAAMVALYTNRSTETLAGLTITYTATVGSETYTATKYGYSFAAGKYYAGTLTMTKTLAAGHVLTAAKVGEIICSDGKAYAAADKDILPTGVTAVAKVCYVSEGHGLALALADESSTMNWETARTTAAAHTPTITGGTWKLASESQWRNMFSGAGSRTALRDGFASVGGSNLQEGRYWSSTENSGLSGHAWGFGFDGNCYDVSDIKESNYYVRSVLEF